ncbi:hypothetical protein [Bacillus sp. NTK074B]
MFSILKEWLVSILLLIVAEVAQLTSRRKRAPGEEINGRYLYSE